MKMLVCDVDGTILNSYGELTEYTKNTLIDFQAQGNLLVLASGRSYVRMMDIALDLKMDVFNGFLIDANGSSVYCFSTKERKRFSQLTSNRIDKLHNYFSRLNVELKYFCDDAIYTFLSPQLLELKTKIRKEMKLPEDYPWTSGDYSWFSDMRSGYPYQQLIHDTKDIEHVVNKLSICQEADVLERIRMKFKESYLAEEYEITYSSKRQLDVTIKGVTKGNALRQLLVKINRKPEDMYIFGDGENDKSMMDLSDNSYVMGNAAPALKKSGYKVILTNDQDGVAKKVVEILR